MVSGHSSFRRCGWAMSSRSASVRTRSCVHQVDIVVVPNDDHEVVVVVEVVEVEVVADV